MHPPSFAAQDKGSARVASQVLSALAHLAPDLVLVSAAGPLAPPHEAVGSTDSDGSLKRRPALEAFGLG